MKTLLISNHVMSLMTDGHEVVLNLESNEHDMSERIIKGGYGYQRDQFNNGIKPYNTEYTDRLWQEDTKKHDALCVKHFGNSGQMWGSRTPEAIQAFLSEYLGYPVQLCRVKQHENQSTGNYYWRLDYNKIP